MKAFTKDTLLHAIANTKSMQEAARLLKCSYSVFKKYAVQHGVFVTNQSGKGTFKGKRFKTAEEVFVKNKTVSNSALRRWYLRLKEYKCEICNLKTWQDRKITLELDHISGDKKDNRLDNLRLLCPNCHSQTDTWRKKK